MFFKKSKKQLVAVFDIGSASVGGLLFYKRKDQKPEILAISRQSVDYSNKKQLSLAWKSMRDALSSVSGHLQKNISQKPDVAFCVFSAPWYIPQVKIIKVKRETPFEISKSLIQEIITDETSAFKKDFFLEKCPLKTNLNGYEVVNVIGKHAKLLELHTYFSLGEEVLIKKIKQNVLHHVKDGNIHIHSFPFVIFKVLKNILDTKEGMVLIDINGDITDVILIHDNTIKEISSFSKGENFFIRRVASAFNINMDEAKITISQYKRDELDSTYTQKIKDVLKTAGEEWGKNLKELLKESAKDKALPANLYFCGHAGHLKEIYERVGGDSFSEFTFLKKPFNIKFLLSKSLKHHFDLKEEFSNKADSFLLISSLFANQLNIPKL